MREKCYQFSSQRLAQYSTLAILYDLHKQNIFAYNCDNCNKSIGTRYHCTVCDVSILTLNYKLKNLTIQIRSNLHEKYLKKTFPFS